MSSQVIHRNAVKRILIRSANWVGDAVMSTPAIRGLRTNFPEARIVLLAKPWVVPVFENSADVDEIMIYDASGRHRPVAGFFRLVRDMREGGFDLAFLIQNAFEAALLSRLAGIPIRVGYDTDARTLLLSHPVRLTPPMKKAHQIDYYLGILRGAGLVTGARELSLFLTEKERLQAGDFLARNRVPGTRPLIGINPGAAFGWAKRWPAARYAELALRLRRSLGAFLLVFGGPGEESLGEEIASAVGEECLNLSGKTGLREAFALMERCRLFITNDSGLMHAAAALRIPLVALFGSTDPEKTGPVGPQSRILRLPVSCSPCMKPECPEKGHRCMEAITVDMVFKEVEGLL